MSKLVTVKEYAKLLDISLGTIYKYIKADKLKSVKQNGKIYVVIEDNSKEKKQTQTIEVIQDQEVKIEVEDEVEILKVRIRELENYMQLCQRLIKNNGTQQESLPPVVEVDLMDYLICKGFTKTIRKKIHKRCLEKDEPRFRKEKSKIFLNPAKFDYEDILTF